MRDWGLLNQLNNRSIPLNAALLLTHHSLPIRGAVLHRFFGRNYPTYIWRSSGVKAFVQYRLNPERTQAHILWLGSAESAHPHNVLASKDTWQAIMGELTMRLAGAGVQSIVAEVAEDSPEQEILRDLGFATYTRQDIWSLDDNAYRPTFDKNVLATRTSKHDWDIELLYAHIVPNIIRLVEPHPPTGDDSWVLYEGHDLRAYAQIEPDHRGSWLNLFVSLDAKTDPKQIVRSILQQKAPAPDKPIFCSVRNYQEWLQLALEANNFVHRGSQLVMVKHTMQQIKKSMNSLEQVLSANSATARTNPIINKSSQRPGRKLRELEKQS